MNMREEIALRLFAAVWAGWWQDCDSETNSPSDEDVDAWIAEAYEAADRFIAAGRPAKRRGERGGE